MHIQLATRQKAFCGCSIQFGAPPNSLTCPVCRGEPGYSPQLNREAVRLAFKTALALNCQPPPLLAFDRKHYRAADLPKGYQITQWRYPAGRDGYLEVPLEEHSQQIAIKQVHLEEDAGRILTGMAGGIDFNRAGIPLLEVVTRPVFRSATAVRAFLEELQRLVRHLGVSDARIEEGSMRCEPSVSLRPLGGAVMGELCEIKNIASFGGVVAAIAYEEQRQAALLEQGQAVPRETRRWDEVERVTQPMRSKEQAADYRYLPEPQLEELEMQPQWLQRLRQELPELPAAKRRRYQSELGLSSYQINQLLQEPALTAYLEEVLPHYSGAPEVVNWLLAEMRALLHQTDRSWQDCPVQPAQLAELLHLVHQGALSHTLAKELLAASFFEGQAPASLARARGLEQISQPERLVVWIEQALQANEAVVQEYLAGKEQVAGYLVGQVMRLSGGLANPPMVQQLLRQALTARRDKTPSPVPPAPAIDL